jgi:5-methylcytosine-specific restriction endonuclease McrA
MRTLILNNGYEPLMTLPWTKAFSLVFTGKAQVIETYDLCVRSISQVFQIPSVIRLVQRVKVWRNFAKFSRKGVFVRDDHVCQYCAIQFPLGELTLDHVKPKSRGGKRSWTNMVTSCQPCNSKKGDLTPDESGMGLLNRPIKPLWGNTTHTPSQWRPYLWG